MFPSFTSQQKTNQLTSNNFQEQKVSQNYK